MKKTLKQFGVGTLMALTICGSKLVFAGERGGNGGDAVVCFPHTEAGVNLKSKLQDLVAKNGEAVMNNPQYRGILEKIQSVQMLDYWEASRNSDFNSKAIMTNEGLNGEDPKSYLQNFLENLKSVNSLGEDLEKILKNGTNLPFNSWFFTDGVFEINDSAEDYFLPSSCLLVQAATNNDFKVNVNRHLYQKMDSINQFTLLLHELVYMNEKASLYAVSNSAQTRKMVGNLLDKDIFQRNPDDVEVLLKGGNSYKGSAYARRSFAPFEGLSFQRTRYGSYEPMEIFTVKEMLNAFGISSTSTERVSNFFNSSTDEKIHYSRVQNRYVDFDVIVNKDKSVQININYDNKKFGSLILFENQLKVASFKSITLKDGVLKDLKGFYLNFSTAGGTFIAHSRGMNHGMVSLEYASGHAMEIIGGEMTSRGPQVDAYNDERVAIQGRICKAGLITRITDWTQRGHGRRTEADRREIKCYEQKQKDLDALNAKYAKKIILNGARIALDRNGKFQRAN